MTVAGDDGKTLIKLDMNAKSPSGAESTNIRVDFRANMLLPYISSGRLGDIVQKVQRYQNVVYRYPLYATAFPQLVDAVKTLHSVGIAHLGVDASTVICQDINCDNMYLSDFSRAVWSNTTSPSLYANELFQDSIRIASLQHLDDSKDYDISSIDTFREYAKLESKKFSWKSAKQVDWFSVGATFYGVLTQSRYAPDVVGQPINGLSEGIYQSFTNALTGNERISDPSVAQTLTKLRNFITEGLMVIEGLITTDRRYRISFDSTEKDVDTGNSRSTNNLRTTKSLMSGLQLETGIHTAAPTTPTCLSYMQSAVKNSNILSALPAPTKEGLPSFIQEVC